MGLLQGSSPHGLCSSPVPPDVLFLRVLPFLVRFVFFPFSSCLVLLAFFYASPVLFSFVFYFCFSSAFAFLSYLYFFILLSIFVPCFTSLISDHELLFLKKHCGNLWLLWTLVTLVFLSRKASWGLPVYDKVCAY